MSDIPSIWGISLKNHKLMQDNFNKKHIIGDIYYGGKCVGYYNPIYQATENSQPEYFVKLEDENFREKFSKYKSIYDFEGQEKYADNEVIIARGLNVLLEDLERLIVMYESIKNIEDPDKYVKILGVINDNAMQVYPFMKLPEDVETNEEIVDFIQEKTSYFDTSYPVHIFEKDEDFVFNKPVILA